MDNKDYYEALDLIDKVKAGSYLTMKDRDRLNKLKKILEQEWLKSN